MLLMRGIFCWLRLGLHGGIFCWLRLGLHASAAGFGLACVLVKVRSPPHATTPVATAPAAPPIAPPIVRRDHTAPPAMHGDHCRPPRAAARAAAHRMRLSHSQPSVRMRVRSRRSTWSRSGRSTAASDWVPRSTASDSWFPPPSHSLWPRPSLPSQSLIGTTTPGSHATSHPSCCSRTSQCASTGTWSASSRPRRRRGRRRGRRGPRRWRRRQRQRRGWKRQRGQRRGRRGRRRWRRRLRQRRG